MSLNERFQRLYAGLIYDTLQFDLRLARPFVVHHSLRSAWPLGQRVVCGPVFTCRGEPVRHSEHVRDMVRIEMFRQFTPGCVQVLDTGGDERVAHFGDISGRLAREHGAVGAVIDGFTRDVRLLERDAFPVFCRGVQPVDAFGRWQIVETQRPVQITGSEGRVEISPGDWVFADADGVLLMPQAHLEEICRLAEGRAAQEDEVRRRVSGGDPERLYQELGRW